ncbi:NADPH:quinone reductase [Dietzia sp. HMSC21D01]|uniref:NADP-dependent oxidoreductase n=1 Tax=Dietzia cinnamea TaxID=321318 RepID=A0AAW5Q264_9ACTN|nr:MULTISPECIES: NADP-dependent oxidoreductase [Dietzia]MCT1638714.1 NADP-dependent oxidoreductase [Dietzia cinnamea]MCT1862738.1 NADP-dependent oxidoreductase [Dietzia cinnamea]MCT2029752.1 NADP-dependent oxidoreductase [Dietzia cinnamea]MCT2032015.1 NADP-dependent oxidoreductase [Dietzia cinnamea]MCT2057263.1 NADP-dependent oxidoreductase [Dietzia cinnamea]
MTNEASMRAVQQQTLGEPDVLAVVDLPRPTPRTNEVLIRVEAASVNPTDWKHRANGGFLGEPPFVLGWDLSGVVEEVGIGVARFSPGDEVFGMLSYPFGHGAHAEYVAAPAAWFAPKPASLDHVQAAALPLVSLTAWQALVENARIQPGQRVLIHAAAGGVGHVAVQLAKARGAHVIGTASSEKHDFLREIGVDEPIDYREVDIAEAVSDVDAVLDTIGGDTSLASLRTLRPGGIVVSILPVGSDDLYREAERLGVRAVRMLVDASRHDLVSITDLVEQGSLRATISEVFPLEQVAEAHRRGETGRTTGKMVLTTGRD